MTLTVHNAEITTATVEVKTLTISGKQVTLAVFRQLEELTWVNKAYKPLGPLWGRVNYCPDPICKVSQSRGGFAGESHLHLVWQLGRQLRRAMLASPWERPMGDNNDPHFAAWDEAMRSPQLFIAV